jgi:RecJ-like exonuclease
MNYPRFNITKPSKCAATECYRCGGSGIYSAYHGVCYRCGGRGTDPTHRDWGFPQDWTDEQIVEFKAKQEAKRVKAREKRIEAKARKRAAKFAENDEAVDGALSAYLDSGIYNNFLGDVADKAKAFTLSEAQLAAFVRVFAQVTEDAATKDARVAEAVEIGYVGEVGERLTVTGEVTFAKWFEGQFGDSRLVAIKVTDGEKVGAVVKTFASGKFSGEVEVGDIVTVTGTVKAHDTYNDLPETKLTRVKLVETLHQATEEAA